MHKRIRSFLKRPLSAKKFTFLPIVFAVIFLSAVSAPCAVSDYAGTYSGTFTGDDDGNWIALIESNGSVAFISWSPDGKVVDGAPNETINASGIISGYTEEGTDVEITVSLSGAVSGTWINGSDGGNLSGDQCSSTTLAGLAGTYTGSIGGDATGTFTLTLNSNGYITGSATVDGDTVPIEGAFDDDGKVILVADDGEAGLVGTVSGSSISGSWYSYDGAQGTFSGSSSGAGGGTDNDGGSSDSGPCFIQLIAR